MKTVKIKKKINIISKDDFLQKRPQFVKSLESEMGSKLFDIATESEAVMELIYFSRLTSSPAVESMIDRLKLNSIESLQNREKQFFGALVCDILESNGFEKSGKKSTVKGGIFSTGEIYREVIKELD
jgi:hypothetical protein